MKYTMCLIQCFELTYLNSVFTIFFMSLLIGNVFSDLVNCTFLPDKLIKKLQKVQNSCVRFLFGKEGYTKWESVTPLLQQAHFLPIKERIKFKIALMVFKCLNNTAPSYLRSCISVKDEPLKTLRKDQD